jgi:hypothetical protein
MISVERARAVCVALLAIPTAPLYPGNLPCAGRLAEAPVLTIDLRTDTIIRVMDFLPDPGSLGAGFLF